MKNGGSITIAPKSTKTMKQCVKLVQGSQWRHWNNLPVSKLYSKLRL